MKRLLGVLLVWCAVVLPAHAHIGNKDVYQTVAVGPYKLFVTVRAPDVIPGVATIEVRSTGAAITALTVTPLPMTGEASKHPPTADAMKRDAADQNFYTGSLWLMATGSWQVRFVITGAAGTEIASVPVPAAASSVLKMQRPMGMLLGALGLLLVLGAAGIAAAAAREARLVPGETPSASKRTRGVVVGFAALVVMVVAVVLGDHWWNVEAADYVSDMHHNSELRPSLSGDHLTLLIGDPDKEAEGGWGKVKNSLLLPDHGHLMHLYAIRWPEMDAVYHLHPEPTGKYGLAMNLPQMPAGTYRLYGDVVFPSGFPETETATLQIPAGMNGAASGADDSAAMPAGVSAGELGSSYTLPDGYTMMWDKPATLTANTGTAFVFHLLDPQGKPAADMQPYLGMAGHAAFVKTDGTAFAHTHPEGSAAMAAVMLAEKSSMAASMPAMANMEGMNMSMNTEPISSTVSFPYGFPSPGRYRIFIQMKHGSTVETGVFDAEVR